MDLSLRPISKVEVRGKKLALIYVTLASNNRFPTYEQQLQQLTYIDIAAISC